MYLAQNSLPYKPFLFNYFIVNKLVSLSGIELAYRTEVQYVDKSLVQHLLMSSGTLFPYAVTRTHPDGSSSKGYELQLLLDPLFPAPMAPKLIAAAYRFDDYLHRVADSLLQYHDGVTFQLSREPPEPNPDLMMIQKIFAIAGVGAPPETRELLELGCGRFERLDDIRFQRVMRVVERSTRLANVSESI